MRNDTYGRTFRACGMGNMAQAAVVNLTPLLFVPLRAQYGFSYTQLGGLVLVNFLTQLIVDLACSPWLDKRAGRFAIRTPRIANLLAPATWGFRFFAVLGHACCGVGLLAFALWQWLPFAAYPGFVAATVAFSIGGGMLEVVISPITNALPAREKSAAMSLMHAFYCWGQVAVVLLTTLYLHLFGRAAWPLAYIFWAALPLANGLAFLRCPLVPAVAEEKRSPFRAVAKSPRFALLVLLILCAGASELTLSQWTSAYAENVLRVPKVVGDVAGMCLFAVMMGVGRTLNGIKGKNAQLPGFMMAGGLLAALCYATAALSPSPALGLLACALCGLGVSLLWPGALSMAAEMFPLAGSWMMAFMAAGGDAGASIGPQLAGLIADGAGLRVSLGVAAVFPLGVMGCLWGLRRLKSHVKD